LEVYRIPLLRSGRLGSKKLLGSKLSEKLTYLDSGVNIDAGNELVNRISSACKATRRAELLNDVGGFAALASIPSKYKEPILVTGTDGVGTKLKLAIEYDKHDTIGQDLVAMCANDVLVTGAEPFLFLDYFATDKLNVEIAERVIKGIANGCKIAGCALVGGETAEMPGLYKKDDYDLAGFCVGVAERERLVTGEKLQPGNKLIALPSSGPHSNGYSLIRKILDLENTKSDQALIEKLIAPTRIYAKAILEVQESADLLGMAHVTGGGLIENLPRMIRNKNLNIALHMDSWKMPEIFSWLQQKGNIDQSEMLRTFNCGVGFVICVLEDQVDQVLGLLQKLGENPWVIGYICGPNQTLKKTDLLIQSTE